MRIKRAFLGFLSLAVVNYSLVPVAWATAGQDEEKRYAEREAKSTSLEGFEGGFYDPASALAGAGYLLGLALYGIGYGLYYLGREVYFLLGGGPAKVNEFEEERKLNSQVR